MSNKIGVIGTGAWGLALAHILSHSGQEVTVWGHSKGTIAQLNKTYHSERLPNISLDGSITFTDNRQDLSSSDLILIAVPSKYIELVSKFSERLKKEVPIISLTKGLHINGDDFLVSSYLSECFKAHPIGILSGPNIALEVAQSKPAASVLVISNPELSEPMQRLLSTSTFRVYTSTDLMGVELSGLLKNIIAIAAGICDGLDLGSNAKSALITRGLFEMKHVASYLGAQIDTLNGLSGIGDLMTTCLSPLSRNRQFGESLVGMSHDERDAFLEKNTVEGVRTLRILSMVCESIWMECPIMKGLESVLYHKQDPMTVVMGLMSRDLKSES